MRYHNYYVYIVTNPFKTVLYIGVTNDLSRRLVEHFSIKANQKPSQENFIAIICFIMSTLPISVSLLAERKS